jgi:hypothetical protein
MTVTTSQYYEKRLREVRQKDLKMVKALIHKRITNLRARDKKILESIVKELMKKSKLTGEEGRQAIIACIKYHERAPRF